MAAQNGKDLLVKIDMTGDGLFETAAGLRATRLSLNAETVDVTSLESTGGWRELLGVPGSGPRRFPALAYSRMRQPTNGRDKSSLTVKLLIFR